MSARDLVKFFEKVMKSLSECGIRMDDYRHVEMCDEYDRMVNEGHKREYAVAVITSRFGVSESTLRRVLRRFGKPVKP